MSRHGWHTNRFNAIFERLAALAGFVVPVKFKDGDLVTANAFIWNLEATVDALADPPPKPPNPVAKPLGPIDWDAMNDLVFERCGYPQLTTEARHQRERMEHDA